MEKFQNYINGEWKDSVSGKSFENKNPSNINEVVGTFPRSNKKDVDQAVVAAKMAFEEWKNYPPIERGKIIFDAGKIMEEQKNQLAEVISKENGKTIANAMGDVQSGIDMAYFAGGEGARWYGRTAHSNLRKRFAMTKRFPVGIVGIITSWNFPMAITSWKIFPALLCGNAVILKSEENTPESAVRFVQVMKKAGLPKGVLNLVHGFGAEAGDALVNHPDVSMISFTGSSAIGKIVGTNCAQRLAKTSLELGGKNAVIVMEDADVDLAVNGVVIGAFSLSGQRCTATSRAIVSEKIYDQFIEKLLAKTVKLKIGPGSDPTSDVTPIINEKQKDRIMRYIEQAKKDKLKILIGGELLKGGDYDKGYYIKPTIIEGATMDMEIAREEIFGPVLLVFKAASYEEAIKMHNAAPYGLSASLFTRDINRSFSFFDDIESGVCYINAPTYGSETHMPFGGVKKSGLGYREAGWAAIEAFSEVKTIYVDYSNKIQTVQELKK